MMTPNTPPRRPRVDPQTVAWPLGLVLLLVALGSWRAIDSPSDEAARDHETVPVATRTFGAAQLDVPRTWRTLARTPERITWGAADRSHTVTLASTESTSAPLTTVARAIVAESAAALPAGSSASEPVVLDLAGRAPRGDAAVLVRFEVGDGARQPLDVVQVWRRDARAGLDLVTTWTSADGTWPASPREQLPRAASNG